MDEIIWTRDDMIAAAIEHWGDEAIEFADCKVVESRAGDDEPCLIVLHVPGGRTSDESGDAGRWYLDGTAY